MKKIMRIFVAVALFAAVVVPTSTAYADYHKPGWGWGDKNHEHVGPPGLSVKNDTNISLSNVFNIVAETGASITINIYQTVVNNFFGNNNG